MLIFIYFIPIFSSWVNLLEADKEQLSGIITEYTQHIKDNAVFNTKDNCDASYLI